MESSSLAEKLIEVNERLTQAALPDVDDLAEPAVRYRGRHHVQRNAELAVGRDHDNADRRGR